MCLGSLPLSLCWVVGGWGSIFIQCSPIGKFGKVPRGRWGEGLVPSVAGVGGGRGRRWTQGSLASASRDHSPVPIPQMEAFAGPALS